MNDFFQILMLIYLNDWFFVSKTKKISIFTENNSVSHSIVHHRLKKLVLCGK